MKEFWNRRYESAEYVYGEAPNQFFKKWIDALPPGRILLPAEGEGRNAVYAARRGWQVEAFDFSEAGRKKALALADRYGVQINYLISDYQHAPITPNAFDAVALIYAHMPSAIRQDIHRACSRALKSGGRLALEAFTKEQIHRNTGGPKNLDMLYDPDSLREDFSGLQIDLIQAVEVDRQAGIFHTGVANLVQLIAHRPQ